MTKKIKEAQNILKALGLPPAQQNEISAYTLIALCGLGKRDTWNKSYKHSVTVTKGIMEFVSERYGKTYAPNTRETFRRQVLHQFYQAKIVDYNPDNPDLPTNSPRAHYALTDAALKIIKAYGTTEWITLVKEFSQLHGSLSEIYKKARRHTGIPLKLSDGKTFSLSPGKHNEIEVAVINHFAPKFASGATLLYLGDTADKKLIIDEEKLKEFGIQGDHGKLPDIILFESEKNWLYLIEVVTSHGPMNPKRVFELEKMFSQCKAGRIYVSAFPDLAAFRKHMKDIAWETEVWIAETPEHMIHFNGDKFIGPR